MRRAMVGMCIALLALANLANAYTVTLAWDLPLGFAGHEPGNGDYYAMCLRKAQPPTAALDYTFCDWRPFTTYTVTLDPGTGVACFSIWAYRADANGNVLQWSEAGRVLGHPDIQQICVDPATLAAPNNFMVYPQPTP